MTRAAILWALLGLFVLRVAGQLAVALDVAPVLPPMQQWYSGLLPYGPLLASQITIIAAFTKICLDVTRGAGYFSAPHAWLGSPLRLFGWLYVSAMLLRYGVTMTLYPERRWTGGSIPIAFHIVLATYLLVLSGGQRRARDGAWKWTSSPNRPRSSPTISWRRSQRSSRGS
jgi:hypothetical protein